MKKRIISLFCSMFVVTMLLSSCGCSIIETIHSETTQTSVGSYSLFRTTEVQEYLSFLDKFDETKFEIVDITTIMSVYWDSVEFYIVTYKTI